jgi:hypothetical protein
MPEGIAGDQSPPGDRIGPTFNDIAAFVVHVMRVGTRACDMSTEAPWLLENSLVMERARSRKRTNGTSRGIEAMDCEIAACELLGAIADAALPNDGEGSIAIGERTGFHLAPRERRFASAARLHGLTSETSYKHWHQQYGKPAVRIIASVLFRLIYAPDTVGSFAFGKAGECQ